MLNFINIIVTTFSHKKFGTSEKFINLVLQNSIFTIWGLKAGNNKGQKLAEGQCGTQSTPFILGYKEILANIAGINAIGGFR